MSWYRDNLQQATWRGIPFGVLGAEGAFGRRNAVHEYVGRDTVWVEDLGRSARRIRLLGFLVENSAVYGGLRTAAAGVFEQKERMIAAAEAPGEGQLVHPTLGELTVSLVDFATRETWDRGRAVELSFVFIEAGARTFPSVPTATGDAVLGAADAADAAAAIDFGAASGDALDAGAAAVDQAESTLGGFTATIGNLARDATAAVNMVAQLPGEFGRYVGQAVSGLLPDGAIATVADAIDAGVRLRAGVVAAIGRATSLAGFLSRQTAGDFCGGVQGLIASLLAATPNPPDAFRVMRSLTGFSFTPTASSAPIGIAVAATGRAVGDLCRRAAIVGLARAAAAYQPRSYDEAVRVRTLVCDTLDGEILVAADQGEDQTYSALRALRAAVAQDLEERGADLAPLVTVATPQPIPALVLAQRLYRDPGRSDELIAEAGAPHPAFLPTRLRALAT